MVLAVACSPLLAAPSDLTLLDAVSSALANDWGIKRYQQQSRAARALSVAAGQLPDPKLKLGLSNFPTDSFDLNQEPMTQIKLGISQQFPGGDTLKLRSKVSEIDSVALLHQAGLRGLEVVKRTRENWYELFYWQQAELIYQADQVFFNQLLSVTQSLFTVGKKQQQDVLRAELEVSRLQERLIRARQSRHAAQIQLSRWVGERALNAHLTSQLPALEVLVDSEAELIRDLPNHPRLRQLRQAVRRSLTQTSLAEQLYLPSVNVDLSYGYRDGDNSDGSARPDFASLMVSMDLPIFTGRRQDRQVAAQRALHQSELARYDNALREQKAQLLAQHARWQQLRERRQWFDTDVLSKSRAQTEATFNAYQSDTSDFSELMRAYLSDQSTQLEYQRLRVDEQKALTNLHFLAGTPVSVTGVEP